MADISTIPPEDLQYLRSQGLTDAQIAAGSYTPNPAAEHSLLGTAALTALAHAGGYAGGGTGMLGGIYAGGLLGLPEGGIGAIPGAIIGGLIGGYGGQAVQNKLTPQLEQEAAEAAQENPKTALATDIAGSALTSGFKPSLDALTAGKGLIDKLAGNDMTPEAIQALKGTLLNSTLNPAINSGISYATTGQLPTSTDLASQAIGGAVFSRQMGWAHNLIGAKAPIVPDEPLGEPNNQTKQIDNPDAPLQLPDKRRFFGDESGIIDIDGQVVDNSEPSPEVTSSPKLLPFKASPSESGGNLQVSSQILQQVIDKGATRPVSVQRIFPKLNLSLNDSAEILRQANEMQSQQSGQSVIPAAKTSDILPPNTITDELAATPLPSVGNEVPPVVKPNPPMTDPLSGEQKVVNSPLSDYNRYQELTQQLKGSNLDDANAISKEIESIKARHNGMPPERPDLEGAVDLAQKIHEGTQDPSKRVTLGQALEFTGNQDSELAEVAKDMVQAGKNNPGLAAPIVHDPSLNTREVGGTYDPNDTTIKLPTSGLTDTHAIIHEGIHALEHSVLPSPTKAMRGKEYLDFLNKFIADPKSNPHAVEMTKAYLESAKQRGIFDLLFSEHGGSAGEGMENGKKTQEIAEYGYSNVHEFSADKFRPEFKKILQGQKWGEGQTVWSRIMDSLKRFLGIKSQSMFDRIIETSKKLQGSNVKSKSNFDPEREFYTKKQTGKSDEVPTETKVPFGRLGRTFQNALDRARVIAPKVADAFHRQLNERQQIDGDVYGKVKNVMERTGFTTADGNRLMDAMRQEELTHKEVPMSFFKNQAQKQVWNEYKKAYKEQGEARIKDAQPVIDAHTGLPRMLRLNPTAHPLMLNPKVGEILKQNTNIEAIKKLHDDFIQDQMTRKPDGKNFITKEEAEQNYLTHVRAIQGRMSQGDTGNLNHFKANRQAEGIPLPKSWTRSDFEDNLKAFSARNAADRSFYRNIEKNPEVMAQLGETKDAWNQKIPRTNDPLVAKTDPVHALLEGSHGQVGGTDFHNEKALSALTTATTIASPALSGVHIPIANLVAGVGLSPNPITTARAIGNAITGVASGLKIARENGIRIGAGNAARTWDSNASTAERMQGLAAIVRKVSTFNDLVTKGTVGFTQTFMRTILDAKLERANYQGDRTAQSWLKKLDPDYKIGKDYTDKELGQLATRAVGYIHGTSDARTMPPWMLHDSEVSGFFSLAHWSVGQTDRFMKDIYTPALRGDITPLLTSLFGAAVGGYLIKELREDISGKKSAIPSLSEIAASDRGLKGNAGPLAYNMIAAMQYSGFGGMFSQIAKYPFDAIYKNLPQGATFPLDETVTDLGSTLFKVQSAIANDPNINWVDLTKQVSMHLVTQNFRLGREAYNQAINNGMITGTLAEKKQLADKLGQLRRFEQVEGLPYNDQAESASNPYMNIEQKNFKMEQDLPTAMKELPSLVSNIIETYKSNPDVMMSKLKALKENQYSTFPSLDTAPLSFYKYLGYLQREEGSEAAQKELMSYMQHKVVNEVKSSVVP